MEQENATNYYSTRQDAFGEKANHHPPRQHKLLLLLLFWPNWYFVWFPKSK